MLRSYYQIKMPSALSESCMKFRLETVSPRLVFMPQLTTQLAPSGGWLASVAIGLSLKTGIYEYTILATIFMVSFIILRTASCESAMILALAYDLVIPFQYQSMSPFVISLHTGLMLDVQQHLAELEKYWPKFISGTAIEAGCYVLFPPDLFNLAVIIKTSVLLIIWMKGKKQFVCHQFTPFTKPNLMIIATQPGQRSSSTSCRASS